MTISGRLGERGQKVLVPVLSSADGSPSSVVTFSHLCLETLKGAFMEKNDYQTEKTAS